MRERPSAPPPCARRPAPSPRARRSRGRADCPRAPRGSPRRTSSDSCASACTISARPVPGRPALGLDVDRVELAEPCSSRLGPTESEADDSASSSSATNVVQPAGGLRQALTPACRLDEAAALELARPGRCGGRRPASRAPARRRSPPHRRAVACLTCIDGKGRVSRREVRARTRRRGGADGRRASRRSSRPRAAASRCTTRSRARSSAGLGRDARRASTRLEKAASTGDARARIEPVDELVAGRPDDRGDHRGRGCEGGALPPRRRAAPARAPILASNTSSIPITSLAAVTKRPELVIGMHFFNPVPVLKLVEVIRAVQTSDETAAAIVAARPRPREGAGGGATTSRASSRTGS